uniref:Methyltransferase domain-containing protein n=1 Tax=Clastoptera arizonana TaxID=38151 RepID=A0A1B6D8D7_9HEMI
MLINNEIYLQFNTMQKRDSTEILKEYSKFFHWTENEAVLDVGCGPGDVTTELLLPLLSDTSHLIGLDIDPSNIEYAKEKYSDKRLSFITADFGNKNITEILQKRTFTKIYSFYCLHWISDQKQVATNLCSLLQPGGQVLAIIMADTHAFTIYKALSEMEKWKPYMQDVDKFISPYFNIPDTKQMVLDIFSAAGLVVKNYEKRECHFTFPSFECQLDSFRAVNPFFKRIPDDLKAEFLEIVKQLLIRFQNVQSKSIEENLPTTCFYKLIILSLYKP